MILGIELKENEWAKTMIESKDLGKKPTETLRRVARYYLDSGYSKRETRAELDRFLLQCDPKASIPKWENRLETAMSYALKYSAVDIDSIDITDKEMEKIDALNGRMIQRLAFTLLCLAKYNNAIRPNSNYWVNNKDSEVMRFANISTSTRRQCQLYRELRDAGMIEFSRSVSNTSVRVVFAEDGDPVLSIVKFINLGYQYQMYKGEPFFTCANCGVTVKIPNDKIGRPSKYCPDCAVRIKTKQSVDSVMRKRIARKKQ